MNVASFRFENLCVKFLNSKKQVFANSKKENTFAVPIIVRTCSSCKQLKMLKL